MEEKYEEYRQDFLEDKRMEEDYDYFLHKNKSLVNDLQSCVKDLKNQHRLFCYEFDINDFI